MPDGTNYTATAPNLTVSANGDFGYGVGGQNTSLVIEFDQPVDIAITNTTTGPAYWGWERAQNQLLATQGTTNGSDWVYLPGSNDALLDLSGGNTAVGTRPNGQVTATSDWGVLTSSNVTRIEMRAGSFDGYRFTVAVNKDTDSDGVADHLDLDSDNDGISDLVESGAPVTAIASDTNKDGTVSLAESAASIGGGSSGDDVDNDGLMDVFAASAGTTPVDSDSASTNPDGIPDYLDLDSDNDFIPCLLYTSPSPRDRTRSRMPSSA